jgi:hypothetical protein
MPEDGEVVIVYDNLKQTHEGFCNLDGGSILWTVYCHPEDFLDIVTVTHWMPLPEPPQE